MDNTLRAILSELMAVSLEMERLRQRIIELEAKEQTNGPTVHAD